MDFKNEKNITIFEHPLIQHKISILRGKGSSHGKRLCIICLQNRGRDRESGYGQRSSGSRSRYHHVR